MRGLPQFILAEVSAEIAVSSPTKIKVGRSLLGETVISEDEQAERSQQAAGCGTAAGAALVGNICLGRGLQCLFIDQELGFYVQLEHEKTNNNSSQIETQFSWKLQQIYPQPSML